MASWLRRTGAYPYDRPSSHTAADQASTSTSRPAAGVHNTRLGEARASRNLMESMQRLMRSWPGMKQLFEVGNDGSRGEPQPLAAANQSLTRVACLQVAVKRNNLTTSLVLLSSVLVSSSKPGACPYLSAAPLHALGYRTDWIT
jgi:hypothetical protein